MADISRRMLEQVQRPSKADQDESTEGVASAQRCFQGEQTAGRLFARSISTVTNMFATDGAIPPQ